MKTSCFPIQLSLYISSISTYLHRYILRAMNRKSHTENTQLSFIIVFHVSVQNGFHKNQKRSTRLFLLVGEQGACVKIIATRDPLNIVCHMCRFNFQSISTPSLSLLPSQMLLSPCCLISFIQTRVCPSIWGSFLPPQPLGYSNPNPAFRDHFHRSPHTLGCSLVVWSLILSIYRWCCSQINSHPHMSCNFCHLLNKHFP